MGKKYTPRRASKRWLDGAPDYVLDVLDDPRTADRYTVLFTGDFLLRVGGGEFRHTHIQYLGMSTGLGISQWENFQPGTRALIVIARSIAESAGRISRKIFDRTSSHARNPISVSQFNFMVRSHFNAGL